jgi:hypothetical protein
MLQAKYSQLRGAGWSRSDAFEMAEEHVLSRMGSNGAVNGSRSAGSQRGHGSNSYVRNGSRTAYGYSQSTHTEPPYYSARRSENSYSTEERQPQGYTPVFDAESRRILAEFLFGHSTQPQTYTSSYASSSGYKPTYGNHNGTGSYTFPGTRDQSHSNSRRDDWYRRAPRQDPRPSSTYEAQPEGVKPALCLYKVMGVSKTASTEEIRKAHRKLSLKWHPDRAAVGQQKKATEEMAKINQARDVLMDGDMRKYYDQTGCMSSSGQA